MDAEYPLEIIPDHTFKRVMDIQGILYSQSVYVQRRSELPEEECVDPFGDVTEKALGEYLIGMSVNIMGTPHLAEYGYWIQKKPASNHWDGNDVDIKHYKDSYYKDENQTLIYICASELEGVNVPYERNFMDRKVFEKYKDIPGIFAEEKSFARTEDYKLTATFHHFHEPTYLNYFHAEIWLTHGDIKVKDLKPNPEWKEKLTKLFKEAIRARASLKCPNFVPILESEYK